MKYPVIILVAILTRFVCPAQTVDSNFIKQLYDRTVDFSEEKIDSFLINANFIEEQSLKINFKPGKILGLRLRGLYYDLSGNYDEAIRHQLAGLRLAREGHFIEYEISALSDLAIIYSEIKIPEKAKEVYLQCLRLTELRGEISDIISGYGNMGAIYNILNNTDSALYFLTAARGLCEKYKNYQTIAVIYNNTGNVYFKRHEYEKALIYFRLNKQMHDKSGDLADKWLDNLNIGDCFIEMKDFDSASKYTREALTLSLRLDSKSKEADSYSLIAKLQERLGNFEKAYQYQRLWYQLDTGLVNESSNRTIAEMQERFHASERENQNRLLMASVQQEKIRNSYLSYLAIAAVIIGILVGVFLLVYRLANRKLKDTNQIIRRQKENLVALNQEKNSLISIVSHDLASPFASILMWAQLLEKDLQPEQLTALGKIRESAVTGEHLIRNILEIEKMSTGQTQLELEEIDLGAYLDHLIAGFRPGADAKRIRLLYEQDNGTHFLLTDQSLLRRIIENLLSNAIKFSPADKDVWVRLRKQEDAYEIDVEDEGPGIPAAEKAFLFTKYTSGSAKPTAGESSTGLGLSIVKRLVSELNGSIQVVSEEGKGACFTIRFSSR